MVTVSHFNVARVKELLALHPTLARAAWDWGFGDWEDALGAASHVGNREIAERITIALANNVLSFTRTGRSARNLVVHPPPA